MPLAWLPARNDPRMYKEPAAPASPGHFTQHGLCHHQGAALAGISKGLGNAPPEWAPWKWQSWWGPYRQGVLEWDQFGCLIPTELPMACPKAQHRQSWWLQEQNSRGIILK